MTYDQIVTFDAVVRHGSFKAAAESLSKSQPSISVAIKKLEEEYQILLFSRDEYRPKLTKAGEAFHQKVIRTLRQYEDLDTFAKELSMGVESEINLFVDAICPIHKISPTLHEFFSSEISTYLNLNIDLLDGLMEKLLSNKADFAIGTLTPRDKETSEIEAIQLFHSPMVPVISSLFYKKYQGTMADLLQYPQIIVKSSAHKPGINIIGGHRDMKKWYTTDMSMKEQLISSGLGWGRLPLHQIKDKIENGILSQIDSIPSINTMNIPMYLMRLRNKALGPNTKILWNNLKALQSYSSISD